MKNTKKIFKDGLSIHCKAVLKVILLRFGTHMDKNLHNTTKFLKKISKYS